MFERSINKRQVLFDQPRAHLIARSADAPYQHHVDIQARAFSAFSYRSDPAIPAFPDDRPIVVFDGACVLCSRMLRFLLKYDPKRRLRFLPAQTPLGAALYAHYGKAPADYETHMLIEDGLAFYKSEAAIRMLTHLGAPWSLATLGRILPASWRDAFYDLIARNRLRWFGARDVCYRPAPEDAERFLA